MISFLLLLLIVNIAKGYNDFPSLMTANATMAVVMEKGFFKDEKLYQNTLSKMTNSINSVIREWMQEGGIDVKVYSDTRVNLHRDYTVLFSIATCQRTWGLFRQAKKERLVHIAITDSNCPRLPHQEGISIPLINPGQELPQLFLDLRASGSLSWKRINILYDTSFKKDTISKVLKALSIEVPGKKITLTSRSLFSIKYEKDDYAMKQQIMKTLTDFQVDQLGNCFLVIASVDMVNSLIEVARSLKMVHPGSQWLYIISDGTKRKTNISAFTERLIEGENVAFIYNTSKFHASCNSGLFCHVKELIKALSLALETSLQSEIDLYSRVTNEEFEILRLSKYERAKEVVRNANKMRKSSHRNTQNRQNASRNCDLFESSQSDRIHETLISTYLATLLVNAGGTMESLKTHGGWKSDTVAERYVDVSLHNTKSTAGLVTKNVHIKLKNNHEELQHPMIKPPRKKFKSNETHLISATEQNVNLQNTEVDANLNTKNVTIQFINCSNMSINLKE